jgi:hypothetical protein
VGGGGGSTLRWLDDDSMYGAVGGDNSAAV